MERRQETHSHESIQTRASPIALWHLGHLLNPVSDTTVAIFVLTAVFVALNSRKNPLNIRNCFNYWRKNTLSYSYWTRDLRLNLSAVLYLVSGTLVQTTTCLVRTWSTASCILTSPSISFTLAMCGNSGT